MNTCNLKARINIFNETKVYRSITFFSQQSSEQHDYKDFSAEKSRQHDYCQSVNENFQLQF